MTHIRVAPSLPTFIGNTPYNPQLLTDANKHSNIEQTNKTADATPASPILPANGGGSYAHIEAQIMAGSTQRTFRRPQASSPREAARAYGQARRRPQAVSDQPRLQNVV